MPRRVGACVPCHTRKVRCDAPLVGLPCTRCKDKCRLSLCVSGTPSASNPRRKSHREGDGLTIESMPHSEFPIITEHDQLNHTPIQYRRVITEHYMDYNPYIILGEALNQARRPGLIQPEYPDFMPTAARARELSRLDQVDRDYLRERYVHDIPSKHACDELLSVFFEYVYPHIPIIDRPYFMSTYLEGTCSTFLLYALFSTAVPYASNDLIQSLGHSGVLPAQRSFCSRARILYEFGCEHNDFALLQGSILLCSFHHSLEPMKDSRFWKSNAVRLAIQMGLHRRDIQEILDPSLYKLYRRVWWALVQIDVSSVTSGHQHIRLLHDRDSDNTLITIDDFQELFHTASANEGIPLLRLEQKQYFILKCQLSQLAVNTLDVFRDKALSPSPIEIREVGNAVRNWRKDLPKRFQVSFSNTEENFCFLAFTIQCTCLQIELNFHHSLAARGDKYDVTLMTWSHDRMIGIAFELATLFRLITLRGLIMHAPPSLIDCAAQLASIQAKIALDHKLEKGSRLTAISDIQTVLAYLEESGRRWACAQEWFEGLSSLLKHAKLLPQ